MKDEAWAFVPKMTLPADGLDLRVILESFENDLIDQALYRTDGVKTRACKLLQIKRTTLVMKLRKRGLINPRITW